VVEAGFADCRVSVDEARAFELLLEVAGLDSNDSTALSPNRAVGFFMTKLIANSTAASAHE
jgi:hypothetical protein